MSNVITHIGAQEIADSRGKPTLSVTVCAGEYCGTFDVPSGASTGTREAVELRDTDGGMKSAITKIEQEIAPALVGVDVSKQSEIDRIMIECDGTPNKSRLGGNSLIGVSIAAARAAARAAGVDDYIYLRTLADIAPSRRTPHLFVNLINGGKHAVGGSPVQEHWIVTKSEDIQEAIAHAQKVEAALEQLVTTSGKICSFGDEGGLVCAVDSIEEPFALLHEAAHTAGVLEHVHFGADVAASSFFNGSTYDVLGQTLTSHALHDRYGQLSERFGLAYIEDPFEENARNDFATLQNALHDTVIIGDDLTTTNAATIQQAAQAGAIRGVIIKPNQIGTLSETLQAMKTARDNNVHCIVSHRSGETHDAFVADLAYAFGCLGLKAGAPRKPERMVKYARLMAIAHE